MADEKVKELNATITITNIENDLDTYNLEPPYQRGDVWSSAWKKDLIEDIFQNKPIPPISLVDGDDDGSFLYVLDGKQRLLSIKSFLENQIKIKLSSILDDMPNDMKDKEFSYNDMKKAEKDPKHKLNSKIKQILRSFRNYNLKAVHYNKMTWADQIILFQRINHSKELSAEEKFLGEFPFVKLFLKYLMTNELNEFVLTTNLKNRKRDKHFIWILRLCQALTGGNALTPKFNSNIESRSIVHLHDFAKDLNKIIEEAMKDDDYLFGDSDRVNEKMFSSVGWSSFKDNINFLNAISRKNLVENDGIKIWSSVYFSLFLIEKFENKCITKNSIDSNLSDFNSIKNKYYNWVKSKEEDIEIKTGRASKFKLTHFDKINTFWNESNLDKGIKNTKPSKLEKEEALKKANNKCEMPNCNETENLQIDHVLPGSLYSSRKYGVLCEAHNRSKSDNTLKSLNNTISYINDKLNDEEGKNC
jgi:hypothetical protein